MAKSLGRKARNKLWSNLGDRKSANQYRRAMRAVEKREWRRNHGL
jgi:hypothetical protein